MFILLMLPTSKVMCASHDGRGISPSRLNFSVHMQERFSDEYLFHQRKYAFSGLACFTVSLTKELDPPVEFTITTYRTTVQWTRPCPVVAFVDDDTRKWARLQELSL